ncbi:kinase activity protein [[Candida] boidinii]|nr:kinase activity protein [[Candida] boidinii]
MMHRIRFSSIGLLKPLKPSFISQSALKTNTFKISQLSIANANFKRNFNSSSTYSSSSSSEYNKRYIYGGVLTLTFGIGCFSIFYYNDKILNESPLSKYKNHHGLDQDELRLKNLEPKIKITNEQSVTTLSHKNTLEADPNEETFEMGLYVSSQRQLEEEENSIRKSKTESGNKFLQIYYRINYFLIDKIFEPIITIGRFIELTIIFLPILLLCPISYFGKKNHEKSGERSGTLIWFKYIRISAELAGASFIKLGQWAASRTDIFPQELCNELGELHSNAKPHSFKATKKMIELTLDGVPFDQVFEEFDTKPIGCGAIAQVYLAKLTKQYRDENNLKEEDYVAVKVVHPKVEIKINRDLKIMNFFANLIDYIPTMEWLSLPQEVLNFSVLMKLQLDLRIEGYNLLKFQEKFKGRSNVKFPKPFKRFSGRKVLIEERINGLSMSKLLEMKETFGKGISKESSDILIDSFLKMLILDNFIHSDLHAGNIFIRFGKNIKNSKNGNNERSLFTKIDGIGNNYGEFNDEDNDLILEQLKDPKIYNDSKEFLKFFNKLTQDGYHPQVCLIDVGLITELDDVNRINFIGLFNALSEFDGYKAGELMVERSKTPESAINKELFALKVEKLVDRVKERTFTLGSFSIGDLLDQMLGMVRQHHVRMEGDFVSVIVAILLLEGIGRQLDPDLDLFARFVYGWNFGFPTF